MSDAVDIEEKEVQDETEDAQADLVVESVNQGIGKILDKAEADLEQRKATTLDGEIVIGKLNRLAAHEEFYEGMKFLLKEISDVEHNIKIKRDYLKELKDNLADVEKKGPDFEGHAQGELPLSGEAGDVKKVTGEAGESEPMVKGEAQIAAECDYFSEIDGIIYHEDECSEPRALVDIGDVEYDFDIKMGTWETEDKPGTYEFQPRLDGKKCLMMIDADDKEFYAFDHYSGDENLVAATPQAEDAPAEADTESYQEKRTKSFDIPVGYWPKPINGGRDGLEMRWQCPSCGKIVIGRGGDPAEKCECGFTPTGFKKISKPAID